MQKSSRLDQEGNDLTLQNVRAILRIYPSSTNLEHFFFMFLYNISKTKSIKDYFFRRQNENFSALSRMYERFSQRMYVNDFMYVFFFVFLFFW